jgi:hypothetical protein
MITTIKKLMGLGGALLMFPSATIGQSVQQQGITSTTQILDTSVLFAIGAREAEQALRGSFGWPTFQEGFVDRVYFRFDPDGYARFSSSPRLDEDVFEVICAESSTACLAKKPSLEIGLTVEGKIQIKIADITPQDTFFVSDRKSELPLPPTILEPLDPRLETLLASGGHLIVKREVETVQEVSLAGFSAVATYLRWVAQDQSSRVFPRGWPVPAQVNTLRAGGLTQTDGWVAPNAGPQQGQTTFSQAQGYQNNQQQVQQPVQVGIGGGQIRSSGTFDASFANGQQIVGQVPTNQAQSTIQSLQRELALLRASQADFNKPGDIQVVDDVAIGFAEQAQARDLHTPVGYGAEIVVQQDQRQPTVLRNDFERSVVQNPVPALVGMDQQTVNALEARLFALENAILHLRDVLLAEMRDVKSSSANSLVLTEKVPIVPEKTKTEPEIESIDVLEKLLLERLSKRDPIRTLSEVAVEDPIPLDVSSERTRIMELLKQLEPVGSEDVAVAQDAIVPAPEAPSGEGFVTLSDYINQVLKSEGQGQQEAN